MFEFRTLGFSLDLLQKAQVNCYVAYPESHPLKGVLHNEGKGMLVILFMKSCLKIGLYW